MSTMIPHPEPATLRDVLQQTAEAHPNRAALSIVDGEVMTYAEMYERVQDLSRFLHERRGIAHGDRVAVLGENLPNWGVAYFAITTMGAIAVPILPDFHQNEIGHILRHAECKAIFVSERLYSKLEEIDISHLTTIILLDDLSLVPPRTKQHKLQELLLQGTREFARIKERAQKFARYPVRGVAGNDIAAIVYTSGTTGHSKGVVLTHSNLVSDAIATTRIVDLSCEDRSLSILPLPHTYEGTLGLITLVLVGASICYLKKPPSAGVLLPALATIQPTVMLSVPLVIEKMYKAKILPQLERNAFLRFLRRVPLTRRPLHRAAGKRLLKTFGGKLKLFTIGGAPLAPDVELFLREAHFPYAIGYGLTETSPLVAGCAPALTKYRSTGPPLPGTEIRISDPDPKSGEGEILVKGPTVMQGYYRDPVRTKEAFTSDGWFKTGDLGVFDRDNYLYIKGRLKNMILGPNGKNVYPEEIESLINEFDVVLESLVYQSQGKLTARVHLAYDELDKQFGTGDEATMRERIRTILEEMRKRINERLPVYSRIHAMFEQMEPFEKTATQKIKRHLYVP